MESSRNNHTTWRQLIPLVAMIAVPVALQNLLTTTGSMVDTVMLASLGEKTVGAVGLCAQFSSLMFSGYWGFVGGGMLFFAQYYGAGNHGGIRKAYGITVSFMMISGLICGFLALFRPSWVMALYTGSPEIQKIGIEYLKIVGLAYPLQIIATAMSALLRSIEKVKIPLYGAAAGVVTNFLCNYLLIFGKLGLPRLGVRGAAVGTVLAGVMNIAVILFFVVKEEIPYLRDYREHFRWNGKLLREYLTKCTPIIANEIFIGVGFMMVNIVLGHQEDAAIAATAVFRTLEGVIISFFAGFSSAATVLVGKEVGSGNHELAFSRGFKLVYLTSAMTFVVCLCLVAFHSPLLHVMGLSGASYSYAKGMLLIFSIAGVIRMGNWCMNDTFRASGDPAFGSVLEVTFMFLMVQPVIHLANDDFHAPFLLVFALCYCDEPIRYFFMQRHLYAKTWIRPVSDAGKRTINAFREKYKIKLRY